MPIDKIKNKQIRGIINSFESLTLVPTVNAIIDITIVKTVKDYK